MIKTEIKISCTEYNSENELEPVIQELVKKAKETVHKAYSPYSKFSVGSAILLENNEIFCGNNQENAAYPSGLCAERVALYYANSLYPDIPVKAIVICAFYNDQYLDYPVPPCGGCRQVMLETETRFKNAIKIYLVGNKKIIEVDDAKSLLPLTFDDSFLKI